MQRTEDLSYEEFIWHRGTDTAGRDFIFAQLQFSTIL